MAYYISAPDPKAEIQIEELHPRCIEVWFIPEDDRLRTAGIDPKDRDKHRVQLLLVSAQDQFISIYPVNTLPTNQISLSRSMAKFAKSPSQKLTFGT